MNQPIQLKTRTSLPKYFSHRALLLALALTCLALSPTTQAVMPPPDGGYPGNNTAEGDNALLSLTSGNGNTAEGNGALYSLTTGFNNTAIGFQALYNNNGGHNTANGVLALRSNTSGSANTANGAFALEGNINGDFNTATGYEALISNTAGAFNTANGAFALEGNTTGSANTANGYAALYNNTTGFGNAANGAYALENNTDGYANTATGFAALVSNTNGQQNTATGFQALDHNTSGGNNTANGVNALVSNTVGTGNTAIGFQALWNNISGTLNIALGFDAGQNLTTESNNIDIGNDGYAGDNSTIRIGTQGTQTSTYIAGISGAIVGKGEPVFIDSNGQLGTKKSSERFKDEIKPMNKASEAILALEPVAFRYKKQFDPEGVPQFGLIAEEVAKVSPDLVVRDAQGNISNVRYDAVNAMLLNEFLKEHQKVQKLEEAVAALNKRLKAQDAKIDKANAKVVLAKPVRRTAANP
jgi:Chaperone of endosialidase